MDRNKKSMMLEIREWIMFIVIAFFIVLFLNSEAYAITQVSQYSMENTLFQGDLLYVDKIVYHFIEPKAGDIIVFLQGETRENVYQRFIYALEDMKMRLQGKTRRNRLIKRVIGVPGDEIDIKDGKIYVNDKELEEAYVKGNTYEKVLELPVKVPEGKLFVMGDNRERSSDSRAFGFVDYKSIEGKAVFRFWPIKKLGCIK